MNGGFLLDAVDIYKIPASAITKVADIRNYSFDSAAELDAWQFNSLAQYTAAGSSKGGGSIQLTGDGEAGFAFGQFNLAPAATIPTNTAGQTGKLFYRANAEVAADAGTAAASPEQRWRLSYGDFTYTAGNSVQTGTTGTTGDPAVTVPTAGNIRNVNSYLPARTAVTNTDTLTLGWDILSFGAAAADTTISLNDVDVDLIRIANYPE